MTRPKEKLIFQTGRTQQMAIVTNRKIKETQIMARIADELPKNRGAAKCLKETRRSLKLDAVSKNIPTISKVTWKLLAT